MELSSKRHLLYLCPHRQPSLETLLQTKHLGLTWVDSTHLDAAVAQTQQLIQALLAHGRVTEAGMGLILFESACDAALPLQQTLSLPMLLVNPDRREFFSHRSCTVIEEHEERALLMKIQEKLENLN